MLYAYFLAGIFLVLAAGYQVAAWNDKKAGRVSSASSRNGEAILCAVIGAIFLAAAIVITLQGMGAIP